MNDNDILIAHMNDLASKTVRVGIAASKFLTLAESQSVSAYFSHRKDATLVVDGGFEGAERDRVIFTNPDWENTIGMTCGMTCLPQSSTLSGAGFELHIKI
jgi:RNA-binding protein YlmH